VDETTQKCDFVLAKSDYGSAIVSEREQAMPCIWDDETDAAAVEKSWKRVVRSTRAFWTHYRTSNVNRPLYA
jgi:hypothetical protein